jgi:hypothetical protein
MPSSAVLLLPRKIGNYEHSIEICMITTPIKATQIQAGFVVAHGIQAQQ